MQTASETRLRHMPPVENIMLPRISGDAPPQDQEWCTVTAGGKRQKILFHDYGKIYSLPGFYEKLFYDTLQCCSPARVVDMLDDVMAESGEDISGLSVLDIGAGNGMVGEELRARAVQTVVGVDIIPEARAAALRDRPGLYRDYLVADLTDLAPEQETSLRRSKFNGLCCVAALGFGDIPAAAFSRALDMIATPGWLAFNIKEDFLRDDDQSGFCQLIRRLNRGQVIQFQYYRRYRHRLSITGDPLYYVAVIARKLREVPAELLQ